MSTKVVYLMRGLPACGKSHTARRLAGLDGIVLETDAYFTTGGAGGAQGYQYSEALLPAARRWNFDRFRKAIAAGISPIVVDRGNGLNAATQQYARHAIEHGYGVELQEPESPWWQEIRVLLKDQNANRTLLREWAQRLAEISRATHRVPAATIQHWMDAWQSDLTVAEILSFQGSSSSARRGGAPVPSDRANC